MLISRVTRCEDCAQESGRCGDDEASLQVLVGHWERSGYQRGVFMVWMEEEQGRLCSAKYWGISAAPVRQLRMGDRHPRTAPASDPVERRA